jgi:hypothetical protein
MAGARLSGSVLAETAADSGSNPVPLKDVHLVEKAAEGGSGSHLKSMRGGPRSTAPIRAEQAQILVRDLRPNFKGIIAGDWNTFL